MPKSDSIPSRVTLVQEFVALPDAALCGQETVAAVRDCSTSKLERDRWAGTGIPYLKIGSSVRYRKSDVLAFLGSLPVYKSTSEDPATNRSRQAGA